MRGDISRQEKSGRSTISSRQIITVHQAAVSAYFDYFDSLPLLGLLFLAYLLIPRHVNHAVISCHITVIAIDKLVMDRLHLDLRCRLGVRQRVVGWHVFVLDSIVL